MRKTTQISGGRVVAALALVLLASSPLVAGQPTVSFGITGAGSGGTLDGIFTSPYQGTINNSAVNVICDDFANNSYVPENWTAYVTSLSSINAGTDTPGDLKWNNAVSGGTITVPGVTGSNLGSPTNPYAAWNLSQQTAYDVAAYLAIELDSSPKASQTSEDLSYAIWELFDATGASGSPSDLVSVPADNDKVVSWLNGYSDATTLANATQDVENAITQVCANASGGCTSPGGVKSVNGTLSFLNGWSINIYTYDPAGGAPTCNGGACSSAPPQEFITVPESSSVSALAVYFLFGGGSLLFWGRGRIVRSDS